ncbi:MAG TPA: peptidase M28 family protein [Bacteroidales bacterium]|nr:peptidase M28 family protein [Bacteroidales bacterium]
MKNLFYFLLFSLLIQNSVTAQSETPLWIKTIYDNALTSRQAYNQLELLCDKAPGRLIGTPNSFIAVDLMKKYLEDLGADTVFLQKFSSPAWICHSASASLILNGKEIKLHVDALGPSASTPKSGIQAEIVEVMSLNELRQMKKESIEGKIVFFNRPMNPTTINTFQAYSEAVDQRSSGPALAKELGAIGSITRSVNMNLDDFPHTGSVRFSDGKIPTIAISTNDAEKVSQALKANPKLKIKIKVDAEDIVTNTYNLIADLKGSEKPDEYMVVGGHIDAWHNTQGAHDDGVGCLQSTEVLRLFKETGMKNKRSIRVILFMDEELYQSGGKAYAAYSKENNIKNYFALESDAGGFTPLGFMIDTTNLNNPKLQEFQKLLEPYGIHFIIHGGGGVDIGPLKTQGVTLSSYRSDWHRYFELHHCANDSFDKINFREMQLGSAAMTSLIYLIDQFDLAE